MSSVIEINSSEDEFETRSSNKVEDVLVLSEEIGHTSKTNSNTTEETYNIDLTNDLAVKELIEDLKRRKTSFTSEFLQFIQLVYDLESSDGMKRIILKKLVPSYTKSDQNYITSKRFKMFILNSIYKLNTDPNHKFSHLKEVCDVLKSKKVKKRAELIPLGHATMNNKKRSKSPTTPSKRQKCDTIDLDQISDVEMQEEVIVLNDEKENNTQTKKNGVKPADRIPQDDSELIVMSDDEDHCSENQINNNKSIQIISQDEPDMVVTLEDEKENYTNPRSKTKACDKTSPDIPDLMVESKSKMRQRSTSVYHRILEIESSIKTRKIMIEQMETLEVNLDDEESPYIMVDGLKAELVLLYKELCKLKGKNFIRKTKQIKLYPAHGRHPGPSQKLESWLNSHTDENGLPQFPDLFDVVQSVTEANTAWSLGWDKQQILHEARLLFIQCGQALQRRRQKREWKDLLHSVDDGDPAETDLGLRAKLEANRKDAQRREAIIIEHYSSMEMSRNKKRCKVINSTALEHTKQTLDPSSCNNLKLLEDNSKSCTSNLELRENTSAESCRNSPLQGEGIDFNSIPSTSNDERPSCFQDSLVAFIEQNCHEKNFIGNAGRPTIPANNEPDSSKGETKNQNATSNTPYNIVLHHRNHFTAVQEMRLNYESQMENENNTNIELDRLGNFSFGEHSENIVDRRETVDETESTENVTSERHDNAAGNGRKELILKVEPDAENNQEAHNETEGETESTVNVMTEGQDIATENGETLILKVEPHTENDLETHEEIEGDPESTNNVMTEGQDIAISNGGELILKEEPHFENDIEVKQETEDKTENTGDINDEQDHYAESSEEELILRVELEGGTIKPEVDILEETDTVIGNPQLDCNMYVKTEIINTATDNIKEIISETNTEKSDILVNNNNITYSEVKVKTEIKEEEDETLKLMLEFDEEIDTTVITTVLEVEEPVVFIEISSSEDESDSDIEYIDEDDSINQNNEPL